jgi:hypothetical protein
MSQPEKVEQVEDSETSDQVGRNRIDAEEYKRKLEDI